MAQRIKRLPAMHETWVRSLGWEDPLKKEMATHSSILARRIPWTEEPVKLQSTGSQRVRHDWVASHTHPFFCLLYSVIVSFQCIFFFLFQYCILQLWLLFIFFNSLLKKKNFLYLCSLCIHMFPETLNHLYDQYSEPFSGRSLPSISHSCSSEVFILFFCLEHIPPQSNFV